MTALALLTCFSLGQTSPPVPLDTRFAQILALSGPRKADAERELRADARAAAPALAFAVRSAGPSVLQEVLRERKCMSAGIQSFYPSPARGAATLLVALAGEDAQIRGQLATSAFGLDRLIAIISVWGNEEALARLGQLEMPALDEAEHQLLAGLVQCSTLALFSGRTTMPPPPTARDALLGKLVQSMTKRDSCDDASGATALVEAGPFEVRGWSSSESHTTFNVHAKGTTTAASPECLFATYEPIHAKGDGSHVLLPLIESSSSLSQQALNVLERDHASYPADSRRNALRVLLSRGRVPDKLSEFTIDERRTDSALLRPWLLTGDPVAEAHLLSKLFCPFRDDALPALTALKDKKAALGHAQRLAATCPEVRATAMGVLFELKDPKWLSYAPVAVLDLHSQFELEQLLRRVWSPAVKAQLLALPPTSRAFHTWRARVVKSMPSE